MRRHSAGAGGGGGGAGDWLLLYVSKWKRLAVLLLLVWVLVTYFVISPLRCGGSSDEVAEFQARLRRVSAQLEALKKQHTNLIAQIKRSTGATGSLQEFESALLEGPGPSAEYESLRRRLLSNTRELWYYAQHQLAALLRPDPPTDSLHDVMQQLAERKRSLLSDHEQLSEVDGHGAWRAREAANVSALVQRRLHHLQHPADCRQARKLICNLNKGCGFGCQVHHIVYCLVVSYATERTLVLHSRGWRYNAKGWEYVFHPLSDTCNTAYDDKVVPWPVSYDAKVVSLPFVDSITQKPKFLPLAVPKDLAHRIVRFNGDPSSWWVGQMLRYVLRPRPHLLKAINDTIDKMKFASPIVGVHIRRTDKVGTEAAFHHLDEYMARVRDYYDTRDVRARAAGQAPATRRVYLASDDAHVLSEARAKYPQYEILGDASIAQAAATHRRYTPHSLAGLLVDLHLLARADYLVCTFSSQVGRVAYEMMQANRPDASDSYFSLDDIYYFGGQNAHHRAAVLPHAPAQGEMALAVGDLVGIAGNHWNGYGRGTNKRTNVNGLVPWYKTADHLVLYPFPEYKHVPLYDDTAHD